METMKRNTLVGVLALVMSVSLPGMAQIGAERAAKQPPSITVTGNGETQARPDVAYVTVGVVTSGRSAQESSQENANQTDKVVGALRGAGIAEKDIQTSGYSVQPLYKNNDYSAGIVAYQVSNSVRAVVRKLASIGKVIDAAIGAGANNVQGVGFGLEKRQGAEDKALAEAVANARRKADVIARAAGLRIVGVRSISTIGNEPRPVMMESLRAGMAASTPISPGELTVGAQVTAVFDVAPAGGQRSGNGPRELK